MLLWEKVEEHSCVDLEVDYQPTVMDDLLKVSH